MNTTPHETISGQECPRAAREPAGLKKLHLHVKTEYFDQIKAGTKTEEYRLVNPYWVKKLGPQSSTGGLRDYAGVVIYNAYKPGQENRLEFPYKGWVMKRLTHPHFGKDEVSVYAIPLHASRESGKEGGV